MLETLSPPTTSPESLTPKADEEPSLDAVDTPQSFATKQPQEYDMPRTKLISRFNKSNALMVEAEATNSQQLSTSTMSHKEQAASPPPAPLPAKHGWSHSPSRYLTSHANIYAILTLTTLTMARSWD